MIQKYVSRYGSVAAWVGVRVAEAGLFISKGKYINAGVGVSVTGVNVIVDVGVRVAVGVSVIVGPGVTGSGFGILDPNSYAPISQTAIPSMLPSMGLTYPRWSMLGHTPSSAASMAGLPVRRAWVIVSPPLSWSGPSTGFVSGRSPASVKAHVLSRSIL